MNFLGNIPFAEYAPDLSGLNGGTSENIKNVIPSGDHYRPFRNLSTTTDALNTRCLGAIAVKAATGTVYNYAGTATKLYSSGAVSNTDVTRAVGGDYASTGYWRFTKWGEKVIATNYDDDMQIITLGGANFSALSGSPPKAKFVTNVKNFVVIANLDVGGTDYPYRVKWSGINNETQWTISSVTQSDQQDLISSSDTGGGDITGIVGGNQGTIFQERSIWRMVYVGSPIVFRFDEMPGLGCIAPNSIVNFGEMIWFLGNDGFYQMSTDRVEPIGFNKVDRTFLLDFVSSNVNNIVGAYDPINRVVMWAYASTDSTDGVPDKILIYSWIDRRWSIAEVGCDWIYAGISPSYTLEDLDSISSDLDALTSSLDSKDYQGGANILMGFDTAHKRGSFNGSIMAAELETQEAQISALQDPPKNTLTRLQGIRPIIDGTATASVKHRMLQTDTATESNDASPNSHTGIIPLDVESRYHRAVVNTTGDYTYAKGVDMYGKFKGKK